VANFIGLSPSGRMDLAIDVATARAGDLESVETARHAYAWRHVPDLQAQGQVSDYGRLVGRCARCGLQPTEGRSYVENCRGSGSPDHGPYAPAHHMPALEIVRRNASGRTVPLPLAESSGLAVLPLPPCLSALARVLYWRSRKCRRSRPRLAAGSVQQLAESQLRRA